MRDYLVFNGRSSADFGIYVASANQLDAPERSVDMVDVPGRNGSLTIDNERYSDATISYVLYTPDRVVDNVRQFRNFVLASAGKKRLEDTLHPEEFRYGRPSEGLEMDTFSREKGYFSLEFTCNPQRFLKSGEITKTYSTSSKIFNPNLMIARPLIRVYGTGTVGIGSCSFTVLAHSYDYIDIDSETDDCYCGSTNCNSFVTLTGDFPVLEPGSSEIVLGDGITKIEIKPRWWIL